MIYDVAGMHSTECHLTVMLLSEFNASKRIGHCQCRETMRTIDQWFVVNRRCRIDNYRATLLKKRREQQEDAEESAARQNVSPDVSSAARDGVAALNDDETAGTDTEAAAAAAAAAAAEREKYVDWETMQEM